MRRRDRLFILGACLALVALLAVVVIGFVALAMGAGQVNQASAPAPAAGEQPVPTPSESAEPAPTHSHPVEGAEDYSSAAAEIPREASELVQRASLALGTWTHGENQEARRARLAQIMRPELVGPSPWEQSLAAAPGASVTSTLPAPAAAADPGALADPARLRLAQTVEYTVHLPKRDGQETVSTQTATWFFTVDATAQGGPVITEMVEPSAL